MNRDDPFAEPSDTDKTVIRPNPAGRRTAPQVATPAASPSPAPSGAVPSAQTGPDVAIGAVATGLNPLNAAASSLFLLVGRIRNRAQHGQPRTVAGKRGHPDPYIRKQGASGRCACTIGENRPLCDLCHNRRCRAEYALGQPERLGTAEHGRHLSQGNPWRGSVFRPAGAP